MRSLLLVLALLALTAGLASAQNSITTTFTSNNGGSSGWVNMFTVRVLNTNGINITSLAINTSAAVKSSITIDVYTAPSTYVGKELTVKSWTKVSTGSGTAMGQDTPSPVDVADFLLPAGQHGVAIHFVNCASKYTNGTGTGSGGNQRYSNADLGMQLGAATGGYFTGLLFTPRVWNGTIWYTPAVTAVLAGSGAATPGTTYNYSLLVANEPSTPYVVATSLGNGPMPIGQRKLGLTPDPLMVASTGGSLPMIFKNYVGTLDTAGRGTADLVLPAIPQLTGVRIYSAFVTVKAGAPFGLSSISNTFDFQIK